jgi:hypothetical protein
VRLDFSPSDVAASVARVPPRLAARWGGGGSADGGGADRRRVSPEASRSKQAAAEVRRQVR